MNHHPDNPAILIVPHSNLVAGFVDGYPVFYLAARHRVFCYDCVQDYLGECCDSSSPYYVTHCEVNWENPDFYCDKCGSRIESAYAEDEEDECHEYC